MHTHDLSHSGQTASPDTFKRTSLLGTNPTTPQLKRGDALRAWELAAHKQALLALDGPVDPPHEHE